MLRCTVRDLTYISCEMQYDECVFNSNGSELRLFIAIKIGYITLKYWCHLLMNDLSFLNE